MTTLKTYSIASGQSSVKEGGLFTVTIETTGLSYVDVLYWSLSGENINSDDFTSGQLTGHIYPAIGRFSVSNRISNDKVNEGNEQLDFKLFTDSKRSNQVGSTVSATIVDSYISNTNPQNQLENLLSDLSTLLPSYQINNFNILEQITNVVNTDLISYKKNSTDFKFYNLGNNRYAIKTDSGFDEITGVQNLSFLDKELNLSSDIKATFDLVTGKDNVTGRMFRLYNAAFARFPDASGLEYWIGKNASGENSNRVVAQSFLGSTEFTEKYGSNVSNETYVNNLYKNVLGRDADIEGLNYWVGNLNSGIETRYEALLGFAESAENKALFTEMTGFD